MCRETCYLEVEFQAIWQNQYILPVKANLQPQTSQENTLGHFSVHYDNSFGAFFEFSKRNMLLATSHWEGSTQSSFMELS